jgi:hypothetical protein
MRSKDKSLFAVFSLHGLDAVPGLESLGCVANYRSLVYCWYGIWERPVLKHGPRSLAYLQAVAILIVKA